MSGICGAWSFKGPEAALDPVLSALRRRGPDRSQSWVDGPVALGHTLLATTPEALLEVLPLTDPTSGCTITADARIDNRDELLVALDLSGGTETFGDAELILRAYLRWGNECPTHLLGDFAFAVWDPRHQHIFCARDHMGMRQLIYFHAPERRFVFASDAEALLAHPSVPEAINLGRIADYLDDLEGLDRTSTFFEGIYRLPAAHTLTVKAGTGLSVRAYWALKPKSELKLPDEAAYASALLEVFSEAVRCRLRSQTRIGSMLSGGMDSGSVVAIASRLLAVDGKSPLLTFSAVNAYPQTCIESRAIQSTASLSGLAPRFVTQEEFADDPRAFEMSPPGTEPFDSHMTLVRAVYLAAHRSGVRVMLDGVAGDVVLTSGNRVAQLLRQGRLFAAVKEARGEERFWGKALPSWRVLSASAWAAFVPAPIRSLRQAMILGWSNLQVRRDPMLASISRRVELASRRRQHRSHIPRAKLSVAEQRAAAISHPHLVVARERYDRLASSMAIEPRDPFMDLRVVEFCLSLPPEQLQADGWPKIILRRAMADLLPLDVVWRQGKEHLGWAFTESIFGAAVGWERELNGTWSELDHYLRTDSTVKINETTKGKSSAEIKIRLYFLLKWILRLRQRH